MQMKRVCVFCGANAGSRPIFAERARDLGETLARRGIVLVYGGGNVGLMGAVADAALAHGGEVIGVIPEQLVAKELAHHRLSSLHVVKSMHERKAMMYDLADGFIAMPGGFGTFEEFCEILTWAQLGLHTKPCGLLNVDGFYDNMLAMFAHAEKESLLRPEHRAMVLESAEPEQLLAEMDAYRSAPAEKWLTRTSET